MLELSCLTSLRLEFSKDIAARSHGPSHWHQGEDDVTNFEDTDMQDLNALAVSLGMETRLSLKDLAATSRRSAMA